MLFGKELVASHWLLPGQRTTKRATGRVSATTMQLHSVFTRHNTELSPEISENSKGRKVSKYSLPLSYQGTYLFKSLLNCDCWTVEEKRMDSRKKEFSQNDLNRWRKIDHEFIIVDGCMGLFCPLFYTCLSFWLTEKVLISLYLYNISVVQTKYSFAINSIMLI